MKQILYVENVQNVGRVSFNPLKGRSRRNRGFSLSVQTNQRSVILIRLIDPVETHFYIESFYS